MSATQKMLAQIARKHGGNLLNVAIDKALPQADGKPSASRSVLGTLAGAIAMRIAVRSVPGAIVIGGGLIAKRLYERRLARAKRATKVAGKPAGKA